MTNDTVTIPDYEYEALLADRARLDWLETQDCWIGVQGEFEVWPEYPCGKSYRDTVRSICDMKI